jgi:hypothetical protein
VCACVSVSEYVCFLVVAVVESALLLLVGSGTACALRVRCDFLR